MMIKNNILFLLLISFFLVACGGGGSSSGGTNLSPQTENPKVLRGKLLGSKLLASKDASLFIPYAVDAYKISYYSVDVQGEKIKLSGLLAVPKKALSAKSPLLSYQHGTIFLDTQAPSNSDTSAKGIMILAGTGYVVSAPDYIGYGDSANRMHPYVHADSLANASVDMLKASKEFLASKNIKLNQQLFLVGYSEGGYATLALQKKLQEQYAKAFTVTASAAGAGPFDLTTTSVAMANRVSNESPAYMSFLLKSYNDIYQLNKIAEMYQSQYVSTINTVFDGKHSSGTINSNLTNITANLFNASFLEKLKGTDQHMIKEKLALNNIYDWKPTSPTRFYHSPNDDIVPYSNSQKALETMRANGATNVSLGDCPWNSHGKCSIPYIFDALDFFSTYVTDK